MSDSIRVQDLPIQPLGQDFKGKTKVLVEGANAVAKGDAVVITALTFDASAQATPRAASGTRANATPVGVIWIASNAASVGDNVVLVNFLPLQFVTTGSAVGAPVYVSSTGAPTLTNPGPGSVIFGRVVFVGTVAAGGCILLDTSHQSSDATPTADIPLRRASGTIATGDVATLNATPIEMLPAPGATSYIELVSIHWWLDYGTAAYDGSAAGEDLVAKYTNAAGAAVVEVVDHLGFADAVTDQHRSVYPIAVAPVANAAIVAHVLVGEWFAAAGDSPLKWEVFYRVRPIEF